MESSYHLLTINNQNIFEYENILLLKPLQITRSNVEHCGHWQKRRAKFCHTYQKRFQIRRSSDVPVKKSTLRNDGDIKVIANKFWLKYLRQDKVNLIRSFCVNSQSIPSTSNTTFWWALQTQSESFLSQQEHTNCASRYRTLRNQYLH